MISQLAGYAIVALIIVGIVKAIAGFRKKRIKELCEAHWSKVKKADK